MLYAGDQRIGKGRVEKSVPNRVTLDETFDFGFDTGTSVLEGYDMPFDFTGKLNSVTIELDESAGPTAKPLFGGRFWGVTEKRPLF